VLTDFSKKAFLANTFLFDAYAATTTIVLAPRRIAHISEPLILAEAHLVRPTDPMAVASSIAVG